VFASVEESPLVQAADLVHVARSHINKLFGVPSEADPITLAESAFPRVNVTIRTRGQVRGSMSGNGESLHVQLIDAVERSATDTRFSGPIVRSDLKELTLEVWLQVSAEEIPLQIRAAENAFVLGEEGIEVQFGRSFAYYKPSVALTSGFSTCQEMLNALCRKAGIASDAWRDPDCQIRKTLWIHVSEQPNGNVMQMRMLRPITSTVTQQAKQSLEEGISYFLANQHIDGSISYKYNPLTDVSKREATNPVRASGCAYAIALAASSSYITDANKATNCAIRAVDNILRNSVDDLNGGCYISESKSLPGGKLGSTALLLLSITSPSLRSLYGDRIPGLLTAIKSLQADSGLFRCVFGSAETSESQINFFPGQALLALVTEASAGDESCRYAYRVAFEPYRKHFRSSPATAFVGWQAEVWSRAAILDHNSEYADFVFEQIDWLLQFQIRQDGSHHNGGFSWNGRAPNYSSIVYTEAIARAAILASEVDMDRFTRYRDAHRVGIDFCSKLRLVTEQSLFFAKPHRALGGVVTSLSNFEVRSDIVQHSISLALATLDLQRI
jgi:AMMECR1 domain-containing protein